MKWTRKLLMLAGLLFMLQLLVALTVPPWQLTDWLNAENDRPTGLPRYVILMGGGGIPSESSLIRAYYAAELGRGLTGTTFVVTLPTDIDPDRSSVGRLRDELVMRGIPATSIFLETRGRNTAQQVGRVAMLLGPTVLTEPLVVVSSEYHLRRVPLTFRALGFTQVFGVNAASIGAEADAGRWSMLRYGIWNHLIAEVRIARELLALAVGWSRGWL